MALPLIGEATNTAYRLVDFRLLGPGEGRADVGAAKQEELKKKFGAMINASANEIAYTATMTQITQITQISSVESYALSAMRYR